MEYEDAVKIIEESESAEKQASFEINVESIFRSRLNEAEYDYGKADAKIVYVESRGIVGMLSQQQMQREARQEKEKVVREGSGFGKEIEVAAEDVKHLVSRIGKKQSKPVAEALGGLLLTVPGYGHMGSSKYRQPMTDFPLLENIIDAVLHVPGASLAAAVQAPTQSVG